MDVSYSKKASSAERSAAVDGSATTGTSMSAVLNLSRSRSRQPRINLVKVEAPFDGGSVMGLGIVAITNPWSKMVGGKICRSVSAQSSLVMMRGLGGVVVIDAAIGAHGKS